MKRERENAAITSENLSTVVNDKQHETKQQIQQESQRMQENTKILYMN
jgi:hypothetical protein